MNETTHVEAATVDRVQTGNELERCPHPIPFGWFCVMLSEELAPKEVKIFHVFGRDWVLFRGEDGKVGMTDPYCPHLGAHLGYGGEVVGNNIRCPFHHWQYDSEGWCKEIPYANVMPPITQRKPVLQALPVIERYGAIYAWYHPQNIAPAFELLHVPELESEGYVPVTRGCWEIHTEIQEIGENGVDYPHLRYLHRNPVIPPSVSTPDGIHFQNNIGHGYIVTDSTGPGLGIVRFTQDGVTMTAMSMSPPIARAHTRMRWFFTYKDWPAGSKELAIAQKLKQHSVGAVDDEDSAGFESVDLVIWHNKKYRPRPLLCDGDGPILMWRKWFRQFYAEGVKE